MDDNRRYEGKSRSTYYRHRKILNVRQLPSSVTGIVNNNNPFVESYVSSDLIPTTEVVVLSTQASSSSLQERIQAQSGNDDDVHTVSIDNVFLATPVLNASSEEIISEQGEQAVVVDCTNGTALSDVAVGVSKFAQQFRLSNSCIDGILKLLAVSRNCDGSTFPTSYQAMETALGIRNCSAIFFWVCTGCDELYSHPLFAKPYSHIICNECQIKPKRCDNSFVIYDIAEVLSKVLPTVHGDLQTVRNDHHNECSDVRTSKFVKQLKVTVGATEDDVVLMLNTDGAPLFKSSSCSLWPILATIVNLPPDIRKKHVLMLGLYIGNVKPNFHKYLNCPVEQLLRLSEQGFSWIKPNDQQIIQTRVFVSSVLCDSVARPAVQSVMQFNGKYGCAYCLHPSSNAYYSHQENVCSIRTHHQHMQHCRNFINHQPSFGAKGPSVLSKLCYFDSVSGFPIDIMHAVDLGVVKQFTSPMFNSSNHNCPYYLGLQLEDISSALTSIQPPYRVSRVPRSLKLMKHYKAHEWHNWLLYFSPIILKKYLPADYYFHWMLLVKLYLY